MVEERLDQSRHKVVLRVVIKLFLQLLRLVGVVILEQEALEVEEHIMQVEGLVIHLLLLLLKVMMVVMV